MKSGLGIEKIIKLGMGFSEKKVIIKAKQDDYFIKVTRNQYI